MDLHQLFLMPIKYCYRLSIISYWDLRGEQRAWPAPGGQRPRQTPAPGARTAQRRERALPSLKQLATPENAAIISTIGWVLCEIIADTRQGEHDEPGR